MILSIIIPIYNVEKYVEKCIRSCEDQDIPKEGYEVIIVNDGSPDGSLAIVECLAKEYPNIKVISQENQGLSGARNTGLAAAQGEYVWFVDSDDWISRNSLEELMPFLDGVNDIVSFGIFESSEGGDVPKCQYYSEVKTISGKESFRQNSAVVTAVWRAVYRKQFLLDKKLSFMLGVYNEDDEFCLRASYLAEVVTFLPVTLYYYVLRHSAEHTSITNTINPKLGLDFLVVSKSLMNFASSAIVEKDILKHFYCHLATLINCGIQAISKCSKKEQKQFVESYKNNGLKSCYFNAGGKYLFEGCLFSLFPNKMIEIYVLLKSIHH